MNENEKYFLNLTKLRPVSFRKKLRIIRSALFAIQKNQFKTMMEFKN